MKSDPCPICGGTDTNLVDGYYYCVECGTQDTSIMETVIERGVLQDGTFAVAAKRKINTKKVAFQMSGEWYKWHAYNFILSGIADEVISLGASPSFKSKLLWIWILYIKKFHNKEDYETNDLTQQNTILESCLKDSDKEEDDDVDENKQDNHKNTTNDDENQMNDDDDDEMDQNDDINKKKQKKEFAPASISTVTFSTLYAMVYCALNLDKSDIQASDIMRFIREGRLSYKTAVKYVPKDLDKSRIPQWRLFLGSTIRPFRLQHILFKSCTLFRELDLGSPFVPNLGSLVTRYCKELCLPKEFRQLVTSLLELMPPKCCCKGFWSHKRQIPEFETIVMAYIVVGLKMCFGLDDDYDLKLTYVVNEINDEENYVKAYRIGVYEPTDRLFSFGEWLKYLEFRKLLLCKYYQPMSLVHQIEVNSCLITESVKDYIDHEIRGRGRRDAMTFELLKNIPQDTDFNILPKEGFPASLTPLTVYTEHILLNATVEDPRIKLLLSEDFSKYNLNYACVDLKLSFSAVFENVVKGVEEINKDSAQLVKSSLKDHRKHKFNRMAFVIDAENDDVLGNYAALASANGEDIDLEMIKEETMNVQVPKVHEINELNTIEELDAEDNIFGVNFDEIVEESQPTDSSQEHLQLNDFHTEDRDETFVDLLNDSEFDPQNFNREDVIKSLILRYCTKHKIPKPFEYKELSKTVKTTSNNNDANKKSDDIIKPRKPREVYNGELNSNNILKLYKTTVDKMSQEIETEIQNEEMYESDVSIDNNINDDPITDTDIQPNSEPYIERTEGMTNTDGLALEPVANNTDGPELAPISAIQSPTPMDVTDVLFNVSESDLFPAPIEVCNETEVRNETNVSQELQELENLDVDDIVLSEIKKYEEESKKGRIQRKPYFNKLDDIPLAELFRKEKLKNRDRSHMAPLINKTAGLEKFNYYILKHERDITLRIHHRSYTFEKEMLENFPRSYRHVLQTCAGLIQVNSYQLFRIVQTLEESLLDVDLMELG